jgi:DNA-binding NarL/FixJ family response regulator
MPNMISVSLIEDEPSVRKILATWISEADGFRCSGAHGNACQAVPRLLMEKPDVALIGINLPNKSGVECVWHLKPLLPDTQFLMLTVCEDSEYIFNALEAGAMGFLLKKTSRQELLASIRQVYEGGSPMPSYIARKIVSVFQCFREPRRETVPVLSSREHEVIELLAEGHANKEIAAMLKISIPTVNTHLHHIYDKLHVQSRGQAVARYSRMSDRRSPITERWHTLGPVGK